MPPTSPLRDIKDVHNCINHYNNNKYDGIITISESNRNPYFNMVKIKNKKVKLLFDSNKKIFRRQDAVKTYDINTVAYIFRTNYISNSKSLFDGNIGYTIIPKERSIDIDENLDLKIARVLKN